jgi:GNAT superfamily N-acetyltransferase
MSTKKAKPAEPLALSPLYKRDLYQMLEPDGEVAAEANLEVRSGVRWLTNLWVKHTFRRRGLARQIMATVADFGKEPICLHVLGYDGRPVADESLIIFYTSFGFAATDTPGIMKRPAL